MNVMLVMWAWIDPFYSHSPSSSLRQYVDGQNSFPAFIASKMLKLYAETRTNTLAHNDAQLDFLGYITTFLGIYGLSVLAKYD